MTFIILTSSSCGIEDLVLLKHQTVHGTNRHLQFLTFSHNNKSIRENPVIHNLYCESLV